MEKFKTPRFIVLDVIRVLACLLIVFWHIAEVFQHPFGKPFFVIKNFYFLSPGGIGVSIFLILSGLVLRLGYGQRQLSYKKFILSRLVRIYPVYWGCLIFGVITYLYEEWFLHSPATYFNELTIREWICSFSGSCAFFGWWGGPFLVTGWFIGVNISLYLIFPPVNRMFTRSTTQGLIYVVTISLVTHFLIYRGWLGWGWRPIEWMPLARLFEFGLGVGLGKKIPTKFFNRIDKLIPHQNFWTYLGELSFPFFLIHFEFKFLFQALEGIVPTQIIVIIFLAISALVSHSVLSGVKLTKKYLYTQIKKSESGA